HLADAHRYLCSFPTRRSSDLERAGVSRDAMLLEVKRARSKQRGKERQALKKEALNVSGLRQPESRAIRYDDVRSAMAEEGVIRLDRKSTRLNSSHVSISYAVL